MSITVVEEQSPDLVKLSEVYIVRRASPVPNGTQRRCNNGFKHNCSSSTREIQYILEKLSELQAFLQYLV